MSAAGAKSRGKVGRKAPSKQTGGVAKKPRLLSRDEELSDDDDNEAGTPNLSDNESEDEETTAETVDEARLRLAKEYLKVSRACIPFGPNISRACIPFGPNMHLVTELYSGCTDG